MSITESGQDIRLTGKSGETYQGKIYEDKNSTSELEGNAIVCLTNSRLSDNNWHHRMNSIYMQDASTALAHFKTRDDISHVIIIPQLTSSSGNRDDVDDLVRNYLHG